MAQLPAGHVPLIRGLLGWLRRPDPAIDASLWAQTRHSVPWLRHLDEGKDAALRALVANFLHNKTITPLHGLQLDPLQRMQLAASCCLPLLRIGVDGLRGWSQLLIYPEAFRVHRSHVDDDGVHHEYDDELIGESWDAGPLVLSWADVQTDLEHPHDGYCVAIHEMAHKLDALDGVMDGTPPLPRTWREQWAGDFQHAYDQLCRQVDAGQETLVDPYASESPDEFFAVVSECYFSAPQLLHEEMPQVAAHLHRFYGFHEALGALEPVQDLS